MPAMRPMILLLPLVMLAMSAAPLEAQGTRGSRSGEDRERLEERIRARMGDIIRHRLGLDRDQEARLSEIVQEYERRRRALMASERETRQQIGPLLESGTVTDADAAALIERMIAFKQREAELFREEQERLQEVLTPTQVLQFYELRVEIGRRIRALRGGHRDGAENRGRDRPPGPRLEMPPVER